MQEATRNRQEAYRGPELIEVVGGSATFASFPHSRLSALRHVPTLQIVHKLPCARKSCFRHPCLVDARLWTSLKERGTRRSMRIICIFLLPLPIAQGLC